MKRRMGLPGTELKLDNAHWSISATWQHFPGTDRPKFISTTDSPSAHLEIYSWCMRSLHSLKSTHNNQNVRQNVSEAAT